MKMTTYSSTLIENLKVFIKYDIEAGIDRPIKEYLDRALISLKKHYQIVNKRGDYQTWSQESLNEVIGMWMKMQPEVLAAIDKYLKEFKLKKLTKEINATSAKIVIQEAMEEAGLKHQFTAQMHRAKVSVLLTRNKALTIYISYKKLHQDLPRIMESLKLIRKELETLGGNISIHKVYDSDSYI